MNSNLAKEISDNGIVKIKNFLSDDELKKFSDIVKFYKAPKGHKDSFFITGYKVLLIKLLKFDINRLIHTYELLKFKKAKKLDEIARQFFNNKVRLDYIDGYFSKVDNNDILPWHTDQAYSGFKKPEKKFNNPDDFYLKFFIYLTDVSSNNGCMSYIPKSHKIGYEIRKAIYNKEISYQPYWSLKDFRNIIKTNIEYFKQKIGVEIIKNFLDETKFEENMIMTDKYDYSAEAGTMIIFDEGGVHRGSKPTLNDRMVIRYLFQRR